MQNQTSKRSRLRASPIPMHSIYFWKCKNVPNLNKPMLQFKILTVAQIQLLVKRMQTVARNVYSIPRLVKF